MPERDSNERPIELGVCLPAGVSGSGLLHGLLRDAVAAYPDELGQADLPADPQDFRGGYADHLLRFELHRAGSPRRAEIARSIVEATHLRLEFHTPEGSLPLSEHLARRPAPPAMHALGAATSTGLIPCVPYEGRSWVGAELAELAKQLRDAHHISAPAARALTWLARRPDGGRIDLRGQRFAVLGAAAELAPTPLLLAAGASVLWIDRAHPPGDVDALGGIVHQAPEARDLLLEPERIAAAIAQFGSAGPVHLGLFAYAPGRGREWRLAAAMNAIVRSLPASAVASLALFVSPTSPGVLQPEEADEARARARDLPAWQAALARLGLLDAGGPLELDGMALAQAIIPLQGASYQAAQYVEKLLWAERCACFGPNDDAGARPLPVSANVAGISATRSMRHPIFQAAFAGASHFGIRVFEPATTRALNGLLVLHDLLNPASPAAAPARAPEPAAQATVLFGQQVHGGLYAGPHRVESALRIAALLGLARRPALLLDLLSPRRRARGPQI